MGKFIDSIHNVLTCSYCYGNGWQFAGNDIDYDLWACDCNPYNVPADEIQSYHQLFKTKENA